MIFHLINELPDDLFIGATSRTLVDDYICHVRLGAGERAMRMTTAAVAAATTTFAAAATEAAGFGAHLTRTSCSPTSAWHDRLRNPARPVVGPDQDGTEILTVEGLCRPGRLPSPFVSGKGSSDETVPWVTQELFLWNVLKVVPDYPIRVELLKSADTVAVLRSG